MSAYNIENYIGSCYIIYIIAYSWNINNYFSAPTAPPTEIEVHKFNSTSIFLSWRPPLAQDQNGIIQGYHINFTQDNTTEVFEESEYTTVDPYLLINNLEPDVTYTFRVAAYTVGGKGPFSELMEIILSPESLNFCGMSINKHIPAHEITNIIPQGQNILTLHNI